jgi:hypothetical protein
VRQARRQAFWVKPWVRGALGGVALLLSVGLLAQVALHERDRVAARWPELTPWLAAVCEPLGCQIGWPRQIEAATIDSTALVRLNNGHYRLEINLKNTSALALAMPMLELSLTNLHDDVVVRRVIQPHEWAVALDVLAPQSEQALSVELALSLPDDLQMSGYRALIFYP